MRQKKNAYIERVSICWKFATWTCDYGDNKCWFSHCKSANFKCRSCEKVFKAQSECLKHRKQEHSNLVPLRKNETNGTCTFGNINCWVIHENTNKPNNNENLEKLILNNLIHQHRAWDGVRSAFSSQRATHI